MKKLFLIFALTFNFISSVSAGEVEDNVAKLKSQNMCEGCNLVGADLTDANLKGADLRGANLSKANLWGVNLTGAKLINTNLKGANLKEANLIDAYLLFANLSGADLRGANLWGANLNGANFINAILQGAKLKAVKLTDANLRKANLNGADLRGANLNGADLRGANLSKANLSKAKLSFVNLREVNLSFANLSDANLSDANLSKANLSKANLSGANLKEANLSGAYLGGANLNGVKLTKANLKNIILEDSRQQFNLGNMYDTGNGIYKNEEMAYKWYTLSAEQGNEQAQVNLAKMYAEGRGIPQNNIEAIRLYTLAAKKGNQIAKDALPNVLLHDFIYGHDVQKMENLSTKIQTICLTNFRCAFDEVWQYLDITKDGNISLAELSKFQRNLVKFAYVENMDEKVKVEEVAAINAISILLLPITSSSILNSFDYNNDGTLQKGEVFGESEFAKLTGIDTKSLITGMDFQVLGNRLNSVLDGFPFSLMK